MSEIQTKDLNEFTSVTPLATDNLICGRGRFAVSELIALAASQLAQLHAQTLTEAVIKNFNSGTPAEGRCAISPTTKRLYVYCSDNLWHALIPSVSDGVAMPTIDEIGVNNVQ